MMNDTIKVYTKDEIDLLLDNKQDTLKEGENITIVNNVISAKDEKYTLPVASYTSLGGVKAVVKTDKMISNVGVDENGVLWVEVGGQKGINEVQMKTPQSITYDTSTGASVDYQDALLKLDDDTTQKINAVIVIPITADDGLNITIDNNLIIIKSDTVTIDEIDALFA